MSLYWILKCTDKIEMENQRQGKNYFVSVILFETKSINFLFEHPGFF